ncbi:MAG: hypothetical protein J0I68_17730 [Achromobacter sp.]|uniref:Uncharacterized protein n=1 Tax=Achromobacter insuavis TaxID=1287735 RepID=A0A6J4ZHU5_9BURK|nr:MULTISPECIES: hypothetical protein [Achromobacter]MBN9640388.1 hypothetical protein [Achromobacter sp.]CAB3627834.1 hypothetical protein LMG26845_00499 [Achromobacter insuavis]CUJ60891.1 Uncharacterised protein [Achromobacter sp. 2789STDY5608628]
MRNLIRTHWEGVVMALLMTVAFSLAGMLDEQAQSTLTACEGCGKTAVAAKE